jgi:galactokinase
VVFKRCYFIIEENQRVLDTAEALATGDHAEAGRLASVSFAGARDLYEIVSSEMIAMYNAIMDSPGIIGTRGAGAGFGGCLVALIKDDKIDDFAQQVLAKYERATGIKAQVYPIVATDGAGVLDLER